MTTKTFHGIQTKNPDVSDLHRYQQGEGHLQVLGRRLDVVPVPLLAGAARGHPRASPPPVLPDHHRHHPHQLPHDDPHTLRADRIYRVSMLTITGMLRTCPSRLAHPFLDNCFIMFRIEAGSVCVL